jgi:hypothetical protein
MLSELLFISAASSCSSANGMVSLVYVLSNKVRVAFVLLRFAQGDDSHVDLESEDFGVYGDLKIFVLL